MKQIFVIDTIIDDHSLNQLDNLCQILKISPQNNRYAENLTDPTQKYCLKSIHLASENPDLVELSQADAVIFSGSVKSVYEIFDWKKKLHQTFDLVLSKNIPSLAVCFGAQFLAYHLGSTVSRNPKGIEFGPIKINLTEAGKKHPLLKDFDQNLNLFATHQDYIEKVPSGALHLAWNDNSPVQSFQYGSILATQFHMDIPTPMARHLLEKRKEKYLEAGFLKDEIHYQKIWDSIPHGEQSHQILKQFIKNPPLVTKLQSLNNIV